MTLRLSVAARNAAQDAAFNLADAGVGPATIKVYSGAQPATADAAETGTLLVTFTCADPAFAASVNGVKDLNANPDLTSTAVATGTAGWARCEDSGVATPVLNAPTTAATGGTLAAGTYFYVITATNANGETVKSNEVSQVTTGATSTVGLSWTAIVGATGYKVYRSTATGTEALLATLGAVTSYTDTGAATTAPTPPTVNTTGNNVFDGSVGTAGADFTINSTSITSGQTVNLTLGSITDPA